jgi:hypothetical protein
MKSKKINTSAVLYGTPVILSLLNPSKADIREFTKSVGSLINGNLETANRRFSPRSTVVEDTLITVEVEQKILSDN